ncbi:hypothetical protein ACN4EE_05810 [Geminocystis sp. CENA526]|uniref:hypothetical protein n=1 Tax=Geminocystis sp. CENA526 TaxID=1355871 RepID=UPI003D6E8A1E
MKKAYHISSGKLINAEDAQYNQYYGVFQCPSCKSIVTLRKGYETSNGKIISPSFVHPKDADNNCSLRENWGELNPVNINLSFDSKGQNIKYLNKYLINAVKSFIRHNAEDIRVKIISKEEYLIKCGTKDQFFSYIKNHKEEYSVKEDKDIELLYNYYNSQFNYESLEITPEKIAKTRQRERQIKNFDDQYKKKFKTIQFDFFNIYLYPQSQHLLLQTATLIIDKLKEKDEFLKFHSIVEFKQFLVEYRSVIKNNNHISLKEILFIPFNIPDNFCEKYNVKNDLIRDINKKDIIIKIMKEKHYQVFRDISILLPRLKPEVIIKLLKLITLTEEFRILENKYFFLIHHNYDNPIFDIKTEKPKDFFYKLYNNKLTKEKKSFIEEFTYLLLETLAYMDWVELLYEWTESHKQS